MMERATSPKISWSLSQEAFDRLLDWLDQDRDRAGSRYEEIRRNLINIYVRRGCSIAEDLTDETINRVARKIGDVAACYVGDPSLYFYGVANNVFREYVRRRPDPLPIPAPDPTEKVERSGRCLETCLEHVPSKSRQLILEYFADEKQAKIRRRKDLSRRLGIPINTLRTRAYRIRVGLQQCVNKCIERQEGPPKRKSE
jgi:DNA-directed RNA polymerase specialized sigma24 family protein